MAAALAAAPVSVQAADHLDCVAQGYDAAQQKTIDGFVKTFTADKLDKGKTRSDLMSVFAVRAGVCADEYGWSPDAILNAVFYQVGAVMEKGLRHNTPLSGPDMVRLEKAIAAADQDRLWPVLEKMMGATIFGDPAEDVTDEDNLYLGLVIMSSGIPMNDKNGSFAGALLASQAIQRLAGKRFGSE